MDNEMIEILFLLKTEIFYDQEGKGNYKILNDLIKN